MTPSPDNPLCFELPYPPSLNRYYRHVGAKILISREGRAYRAAIAPLVRLAHCGTLAGRLGLRLDFHPPDKRRRDLDNLNKALWDAMCKCGLYGDDSQIKEFHSTMQEPKIGGSVKVQIWEMD